MLALETRTAVQEQISIHFVRRLVLSERRNQLPSFLVSSFACLMLFFRSLQSDPAKRQVEAHL